MHWKPTVRYLFAVEVHVYALSVAAGVLLSFFPFLIVMVSVCRDILHWPAAVEAIHQALNDVFPEDLYEFIRRNLQMKLWELGGSLRPTSLILLLITANSIFVPFEVALNRAWGIDKHRSYWKNQLVSFGMVLVCGALTLLSFILTASTNKLLSRVFAPPVTILALVLIYWLLPNCKVPLRRVMPTAVIVGLLLEILKYVTLLSWPMIKEKLYGEYGPFHISVTILLWSFVAAMIVLSGAEWSARTRQRLECEDETK